MACFNIFDIIMHRACSMNLQHLRHTLDVAKLAFLANQMSKIFYRFQCIKCYVCQRHRRWCLRLLHNTAYRVLLLISLMSKVLKMSNTMYSVYSGLSPLPGGKAICYSIWKAFYLGGLAVHHQSVRGGSFVNFLGLIKLQGWLQARCTANPQFLKLRGCSATSNSYRSTKLHPPYPNQTACL